MEIFDSIWFGSTRSISIDTDREDQQDMPDEQERIEEDEEYEQLEESADDSIYEDMDYDNDCDLFELPDIFRFD